MATTLATAAVAPVRRKTRSEGSGFWREAWGRLRLNIPAMIGLGIIIALILKPRWKKQ